MTRTWLVVAILAIVAAVVVFESFFQAIGGDSSAAAIEAELQTTSRFPSGFDEIRRKAQKARVPSADQLKSSPFSKSDLHELDRQPREGNGRTLMIVSFERSERSLENVEFLMNQVVGGPRAKDIDFIFVDTSKQGPFKCFPEMPNVLYVHRARVGFDICSHKVALALVPRGRYQQQGDVMTFPCNLCAIFTYA